MSWHEQKAATLAGVADYSYFQWDYDDGERIPTSVLAQGFTQNDGSKDNAYGVNARAPVMLPRNAQGLYAPHFDAEGGYARMSDEFIRMDYAPFLRKEKNWQLGILQSMVNRQPAPTYMVGSDERVSHTDIQLIDPGNAIGTLSPPVAARVHGNLAAYTQPKNFFALQ